MCQVIEFHNILPMSVSEIVTVGGNNRDSEAENILRNPNLCLLPLFLCPIQPTPQTVKDKSREHKSCQRKVDNIVCASSENQLSNFQCCHPSELKLAAGAERERERGNDLEHIGT